MFVRANSGCPPVHGFWYRAIVRAFRRCILLGLAGCCSAVAVAVDGSTMQPNAAHVAISTAVPRILVSAQSAECACDLTKERESLDLSKIDRGLCLSLIYMRVEGKLRQTETCLPFSLFCSTGIDSMFACRKYCVVLRSTPTTPN